MLDFSQKRGSTVCLDKFAVEVSGIFYCFVLFRQNLNSEYDGVQEELS